MTKKKPAAPKAAGAHRDASPFVAGLAQAAVATHRFGWATWALDGAHGRPMPTFLRQVASAIANHQPITDAEAFAISNLLCEVAAGRDVRDPLRVDHDKMGHRGKSTLGPNLAFAVHHAITQDGMSEGDAVRAVARAAGITEKRMGEYWRAAKG